MTLDTARQPLMNWLRPVTGPVPFEGIFEVLPIELGRRVTHQSGSFRCRKRGLLPFIPWRAGGIELASLPGTPPAPDRCRGAGHRSECTYDEGMRSSAPIASASGFRSHPVERSVTRPASTRALWSLGPLARPTGQRSSPLGLLASYARRSTGARHPVEVETARWGAGDLGHRGAARTAPEGLLVRRDLLLPLRVRPMLQGVPNTIKVLPSKASHGRLLTRQTSLPLARASSRSRSLRP